MKSAPFPHTILTPIAVGALLLAASASAQTTDDGIATVVVTASADASAQGLPSAYAGGQVARGGRLGLLGNVDIMDAPFNATNYTHALIQDQQARSVADVVQNDPSVRVARGFGNYQELYVIRGFAVNSDDLAYNGLYGLLPRQFVASELLERVEVLRGANSFINGAAPGGGGIGGMINLLPKRAPNGALNEVTVGVESGGQAYAAADVARRFGANNRAGIRVNAVRRDGDTAVDREQRELSVFSVGLDYRGDNYRVSADVGYQDHQLRNGRPSVTVGSGLAIPAAPEADSNFAQPWTHSNERDTFGTLRGEVDLAPHVVAWAAAGAREGRESNVISSPTTTDNNGGTVMTRFDNERKDNVRTGEIGVRGDFATGAVKHTVSATASAFESKSDNAYAFGDFAGWTSNLVRPVDVAAPVANAFTGGSLANPLLTAKSILSSYAVADTLSFLDDTVRVTAGVRHQRIKSYGYDYNTGAQNSAYDQSANTPVAGIVYKPLKNVSIYANYIEALQQGPTASGVGVINQGQIFAPYTSRQKEVGVKYDSGKLGMSAALFSTAQPLGYIQNGVFGVFGEQRNQGLELSVFGLPMHGLRVLGGLTLLDAEQRRTAGGINDGKDAIGVPGAQLNLGADWDVPQVAGLSLNARAVTTSHQYADAANTQKLPSWTRLDLGATYATRVLDRDVTVRARVDNAFGRNYWASAGGYPGYGYLVLGAPRTFTVSATVDF
ncbi:TonB-dependent siderophore receptor [Telluria mixta]|uniref:TonB-dependent siderophore receptor n=1 Tax=Telluria mixta TaxID=34071 RepID=A0ABT2BSU3_9BURK|nr:TonB-dependent siderophore receptor [Telluria mixta]MCS0627751.1 TonB-dependent siderophore receptor [Telluria mixta]WEM94127.1 TonB-dependent siderophore receptor [Telluria mixta]